MTRQPERGLMQAPCTKLVEPTRGHLVTIENLEQHPQHEPIYDVFLMSSGNARLDKEYILKIISEDDRLMFYPPLNSIGGSEIPLSTRIHTPYTQKMWGYLFTNYWEARAYFILITKGSGK